MKKSCSVLVVGAGYLGERVARALAVAGKRAVATTRSPERLEALHSRGIEAALLELSRVEASEVWIERPASIVYAVAPGAGGDAKLCFRHGVLAVARAWRQEGGGPSPPRRRFVLISSTGVFARTDGAIVDETTTPDPIEERHRFIVEGETALFELSRREGFQPVILRLGGLYGPGRSPIEWMRRPEMRERIARGSPNAFTNWIHVDDAVQVVLLALDHPSVTGLYHIVDGTPVRREELFAHAAKLAGVAPLVFTGDAKDLGKRIVGDKARSEIGFAPRFPSTLAGPALS